MTTRFLPDHPGLRALLATQALTGFNHNMLRSALLTLAAFRGFTAFGLSSETVVALSTILVVAPYVLFSIPAGRLADRFAKTAVIRAMMVFEVAIFVLMAIALVLTDTALLLFALLLAGIQAALMGPAKFGILPEMLRGPALVSGNGWLSASGTAATLAGLVLGNVLILDPVGFWMVVFGGIALSIAGWLSSLRIRGEGARDPGLVLKPSALIADYWVYFRSIARLPAIIAPLIGGAWFWFQGAAVTTLIPLYVAQSGAQAQVVSILLLAPTLGVTLGALCARSLIDRFSAPALALVLLPVLVLPGIDLWLMPPLDSPYAITRACFDLFVMAVGSGFYLIPMNAAIQRLTPPTERARFIGISHTLGGAAMILAGLIILLLVETALQASDIFLVTAVVTGAVSVICLMPTLAALAAPHGTTEERA